jgi:hypothetical protein
MRAVGLAMLCLLGACTSSLNSGGFDPPRMITCDDIDLLNGTRRIDPDHVGLPATSSRYQLAGFTVLAPTGGGWCLSTKRSEPLGPQSARITFVKNTYQGETLSSAPGDKRRWHTFLMYGVSIRRPTPWDMASLQGIERTSVESPSLILISAQVSPLQMFGTECVWSERLFRYPWDVNLSMLEHGYSCIHPRNRNYVVRVIASERNVEGAPYYSPPLMETLRAQYQPYLDSLEFTLL